jgi:hypothetical protein
MEQHEIDFIQKHIINFDSVKIGFCRNIEFDVLQEYERIYRIYIDRQFVLTYYCNACVFDMLKRLGYYYDNLPAKQMVEQAIADNFVFPDDLDSIQPDPSIQPEQPTQKRKYTKRTK